MKIAIYCPACDCHHPPREHHAPARTSLTPSDYIPHCTALRNASALLWVAAFGPLAHDERLPRPSGMALEELRAEGVIERHDGGYRLVPSLATSLARAVSYSADALAEARATLAEALDVLLSNNSHRAEDCHTERYAADCGECRMAERARRFLGAPLPAWWGTYHDEDTDNPCPCKLASDPRLAPAGPSVWEGTR